MVDYLISLFVCMLDIVKAVIKFSMHELLDTFMSMRVKLWIIVQVKKVRVLPISWMWRKILQVHLLLCKSKHFISIGIGVAFNYVDHANFGKIQMIGDI